MKVLIVGTGSIGRRHVKNLALLGHELYLMDCNKENLKKVESLAKKTFISLEDALLEKPEVAFICTYSNNHIAPALKCAEAGCHLFIEKPLSVNLDGVDKLIDAIHEKNLISIVGCNMRFHPAISYIYDKLKNDALFSKILWASLETGYYLPFAKPDYETHYMANSHMGGNIIFDMIHELDYAQRFFGDAFEVFCEKVIASNLKIDTGDLVDMMIKFKNGINCSVHMDYLQHGYSRRCKIVSDQATIVWDFSLGKIGIIDVHKKKWLWKDFPLGIYFNQMYSDEIKYFFDCVANNKETFNSIDDAKQTIRLALSAEHSSKSKRWERI